MQVTDKLYARQITATFEKVSAKPIKPVSDAFAQAQRLSAAVRGLAAPESALAAAVAAALSAGRNPAEDAEVQRTLVANSLANEGVAQAVDAIAWDKFKSVCHENLDGIVKAWSVPFDAAAATLAAARDLIGDVPLEHTDSIVRRGGDIAATWTTAVDAVKVIEAVTAGWSALGEFTRGASNDLRYQVLRIADVDYATWTEQQLERRRLTAWEAVTVGLHLSLPTMAEYHARVATVQAGERHAREIAEGQHRDRLSGRDPELARRAAQLAGFAQRATQTAG